LSKAEIIFSDVFCRRTVYDYPAGATVNHGGNLDIHFSRHTRRRAKLYNIPESTIRTILGGSDLDVGNHELIKEVAGFKYPIKIVVSVEEDKMNVITNYPLKRGRTL